MTEGQDGQHEEEEEVAGPPAAPSIDTANGNLLTAQSSHASNHHMLIDAGNTGPMNAPPTHGDPTNKSARPTRGAIDTTRAPLATEFCGRIVGSSSKTVRVHPPEMKGYRFRCPICDEALREQKAVFRHFRGCVKRNGNPTIPALTLPRFRTVFVYRYGNTRSCNASVY